MKKIFLALVAALFLCFPAFVLAQTAKVIDLKGDVQVKVTSKADWRKASLNMFLNKDAEVKTQKNSECTLAFDEELKNILTIKENSNIKIDSLKPATIYMPQGRVFSLIKNLKKAEKFQIKTPTAVAGARATGWETGFGNGSSSVSCFEDTVYVQGLDADGNVTGEQDLASGFGLEVGAGGALGGTRELSDEARFEWNNFTNQVGDIIENSTNNQENDTGERGALQGLKDESRETIREQAAQEQREERQESISETVTENRKCDSDNDGSGSIGNYSVSTTPR